MQKPLPKAATMPADNGELSWHLANWAILAETTCRAQTCACLGRIGSTQIKAIDFSYLNCSRAI